MNLFGVRKWFTLVNKKRVKHTTPKTQNSSSGIGGSSRGRSLNISFDLSAMTILEKQIWYYTIVYYTFKDTKLWGVY